MKQYVVCVLLLTVFFSSFSQQNEYRSNQGNYNGNLPTIKITGKIIDSLANQPVEYANIVIYRTKDSSMVTGTISKPDGSFIIEGLRPGRYYIDINFIGYYKKKIGEIKLKPEATSIDMGVINLKRSDITLDEVQVAADRPTIEYKIDKKIINVSQQLTSSGGTAVDVLENAPSVKVDMDGNVTLRGSSNFTVLIDGRPTFLQGSEALEQIPASTIDNIEIITNPSAKYDPEGDAGIINIILKKEKGKGLNGVVNASIGRNNKYRGDFL